MRRPLAATLALLLASTPLAAQTPCGGSFPAFLDGIRAEADRQGLSPKATAAFLSGAAQDAGVL